LDDVASGNMLTDGRNTYTWNSEDQLKTTAGVTYTYDGDGHRVEKSNGKLYWYGTGSDPLMETDLSGNLTDEYVFFGGKRIARRDSSNNVVYYAADHLGTSRVVASSAGAILDQSDFYPFGGERVLSASSGNTYKFTSKERDSESNLDSFGARYDSSILGRFMSPDPKILSIRHIANPQKWNKYSYVINNPMSFFDPNGMEEITITYRTFIPQATTTLMGKTYGGDNHGFSTADSVSSRTSITIKIETDPKIRPGNPIISVDGKSGGNTGHADPSTILDKSGNVSESRTATNGLPTVTGTRDANGTPVLNIQQDTKNPLSPGLQALTPGVSGNLTVTVWQDLSTVQVTGTAAPFPASEMNITTADGTTTPIFQFQPPADASPWSLFGPDRQVDVKAAPQK
jgi:RHS repeat-associated protein